MRRIDGVEKVTGKALYAGDLRLPSIAYAKVLRSPLPHARIRRIDADKARTLPGVLAVLTRENLTAAFPTYGAYVKDQPLVAMDKVRYTGDVVAAVAASEELIAEVALKSIEVDYEELPAVLTVEEALEPSAPLVHEQLVGAKAPRYGRGGSHVAHEQSNICLHFRYNRGDVEEGFRDADFIFEDTFAFPSAQHYPMEPHVSMAQFDGWITGCRESRIYRFGFIRSFSKAAGGQAPMGPKAWAKAAFSRSRRRWPTRFMPLPGKGFQPCR